LLLPLELLPLSTSINRILRINKCFRKHVT
jgi:hypothetical protein